MLRHCDDILILAKSFCQKFGNTNMRPENAESDFKLLSPSSKSEMGDYNPGTPTIHRYFCQTCGVHVLSEGSYEWEGQSYDHFTVNAATIDQPQDGIDLRDVTLQYFDGLHDNWNGGLQDKPWSGGMV